MLFCVWPNVVKWIATTLVVSYVLAGCGANPPAQARIDGWPVGPVVDCAALEEREREYVAQPGCGRYVEAALEDARLADLPAAKLQALTAAPVIYEMDLTDEANKAIHGVRSGGSGGYVLVFGPQDAPIVVGTWCGAGIEPDICGVWDNPPW